MTKRLLLLVSFCALLIISHGQTTTPSQKTDDISFNGYRIRLFQITDQAYGYDILFQNALVLHQNNNPYTNKPGGLKKEDAIKTARWQVIHLSPAGRQLQPKTPAIPSEVARQLNITLN